MIKIIPLSVLIMPTLLFAAEPKKFSDVVSTLIVLVNIFMYLLMALSIVVFLWGILKVWIMGGGDASSVQDGKKYVFAGVVGLFVMIAVWGIVNVLVATFLS